MHHRFCSWDLLALFVWLSFNILSQHFKQADVLNLHLDHFLSQSFCFRFAAVWDHCPVARPCFSPALAAWWMASRLTAENVGLQRSSWSNQWLQAAAKQDYITLFHQCLFCCLLFPPLKVKRHVMSNNLFHWTWLFSSCTVMNFKI